MLMGEVALERQHPQVVLRFSATNSTPSAAVDPQGVAFHIAGWWPAINGSSLSSKCPAVLGIVGCSDRCAKSNKFNQLLRLRC
jgi:hypothetical protein